MGPLRTGKNERKKGREREGEENKRERHGGEGREGKNRGRKRNRGGAKEDVKEEGRGGRDRAEEGRDFQVVKRRRVEQVWKGCLC